MCAVKAVPLYICLTVLAALLCACSGRNDSPIGADSGTSDKPPDHDIATACASDATSGLYILVGRQLMTLPLIKDGVWISRLEPKSVTPTTTGCRDDPHRTDFAGLGRNLHELFGVQHADVVRRISALSVRTLRDGALFEQSYAEDLYKRVASGKHCPQLSDGVETCGDRSTGNPALFRVAPPRYWTPPVGTLVVMCGFGPGISVNGCKVAYALNSEVGVTYRYDASDMSVDEMLALDKVVRDRVASMLVGDAGE